MTVDVQIAFQGGGARLALFFGVIKALQKLERDKIIRVTRVSGASAGAIAAALFAGRANIDALVQYHCRLKGGEDILQDFPDISEPTLLEKLFNLGKVAAANRALGDEGKFAAIVEKSLTTAGVNAQTIGDLSIPCFINSTDVVEHKIVTASRDQSLVQAIVDSAALPFLFRVGGQKIDGGILDNLPVELLGTPLSIKSEYGVPIGVSFKPDRHSAPVVRATDLAKRLLETVINERVAQSKKVLGVNNFLELETAYDGVELSTFSVNNYFDVLERSSILELVEVKTVEWFKGLSDRIKSLESNVVAPKDFDDNSISIEDGLREFAYRTHSNMNCDLISTTFEVTARCLEGVGETLDEVRFIDVFQVRDQPIHAYVSRLSLANGVFPSEAEVRVYDGDGVFLEVNQFLIPDRVSNTCWVLVLFSKPIVPSEGGSRYSVHLKQGGVSKSCWFALCSYVPVRYAEASEARGDPPCPASIRPNSAACLPA
ncbi:MAG: patatin-like phospholipase family protein [Marivita sp.]|uniref:patatin-like phospholipase family protein n=1 Tax=Marivita sp. TaxID=2003365 RepID=UPI001B00E383|nr:patatin-like phospholipase family protein [Marivita sp.]MBO6882195.1 patatin-like phospholipase family protein [Marivita sp.]